MKITSAVYLKSFMRQQDWDLPPLPEFAFIGRSNVGKSSLINHLVHRKNLVKTSATPGKTRMINVFLINEAFYLVDLPGYGFAVGPEAERDTWRAMIWGYLRQSPQLRLIFQLLDLRHEPSKEDQVFFQQLLEAHLPFQLVANKADKLGANARAQQLKAIQRKLGAPQKPLMHSTLANLGRHELLACLAAALREPASP